MTAPLWPSADLLEAVGGRTVGMPGDVSAVSIDSRTVPKDAAFFAIRGDRFDGHDFAAAALDAGAALAIVREGFETGDHPGPFVFVDDPLQALERLAAAARSRSGAGIVGVTGSVGKTGTKEMLRLALGASGETHASPASFNNHWGVPFSLASLPASARFGVFEMGMNHPGEIAPLSALVRPEAAIITTVAPVHIGHFRNVEEIADAKAEIFAGLVAGGTAILPLDNPHFGRLADAALAAGATIVTFGEASDANVRLVDFIPDGDGSTASVTLGDRPLNVRLGAPGRHLATNALAVLAAVDALGADLSAAADALAKMSAPTGRGERTVLHPEGGTALLIDESYNANPVSMAAALAMLGAAEPGPGGRRIAVLGDMLELGEGSPAYHRELAGPIRKARADLVFASGPFMAELADELGGEIDVVHAPDAAGNEAALLAELRPGDIVMVKGSLGSSMGPLVAALKSRYGASTQGNQA